MQQPSADRWEGTMQEKTEKHPETQPEGDRVTTNISYTLLSIVPRPERVVEGREVVRDPRALQFLRVVGGRVDRGAATTSQDPRREPSRGRELLA